MPTRWKAAEACIFHPTLFGRLSEQLKLVSRRVEPNRDSQL